MATNQKTIFVYDDFSADMPILMGGLFVNVIKGGETYSFEYEKNWLKRTGLMINLDPELLPYPGRQYPSGKKIFGLFADASPDRWGRVLMNRRERILAEKEGRKPSKWQSQTRTITCEIMRSFLQGRDGNFLHYMM